MESQIKTLRLKTRLLRLKTQEIREKAAAQLQTWIARAEKQAEQAQDEQIQREWIRLGAFLNQVLNSLLKTYDEVELDKGLEKLETLVKRAQEWQEHLEAREQELTLKEQELAKTRGSP